MNLKERKSAIEMKIKQFLCNHAQTIKINVPEESEIKKTSKIKITGSNTLCNFCKKKLYSEKTTTYES